MADNRMREDVESAYLDITEFTGQSLTGPRDLITRKVFCSNPQRTQTQAEAAIATDADRTAIYAQASNLQQLTFRILSTSPGAMLNAKVELVCPLLFHHAISHTGAAVTTYENWSSAIGLVGTRGFTRNALAAQIAPRRNGLLKACRSISSTVNSTVSFTTRPNECIAVMEQMFTQPGVAGQTGVYSSEEASAWGNTDGQYGPSR